MFKSLQEEGIALAVPGAPKYKLQNAFNARLDSITIDFDLINKDNVWLDKNFQLLNALFSGSQWVQMKKCIILGKNVYNVIVPGRFQIQWAQISVTIKTRGRLRLNNYMYTKYRSTLKSITSSTLWPDAWNIELTIKPVSLWNFNTYIDYLVHGFSSTADFVEENS